VRKDSALSRQGIPDYLVTVRKLGDNPEPVAGPFTEFAGENPPPKTKDPIKDSINIWQRYASPVWMDINPSDTLQYRSARANDDERHICPLQLEVIRRGLQRRGAVAICRYWQRGLLQHPSRAPVCRL
jgi:hypothetical protein